MKLRRIHRPDHRPSFTKPKSNRRLRLRSPRQLAFEPLETRTLLDATGLADPLDLDAQSLDDSPYQAAATAPADNEPFTVVLIPDTQVYSRWLPELFPVQNEWIAENVDAENVVFVSHVGDVVQDGAVGADQNALQWTRADAAMDLLDGDLSSNPDGLIPYSVVPGNHDYDVPSTHSSADRFVQYFGSSRYEGRSWYGGSSADQLNHYQTFSSGEYEFLHIALEWEARDSSIAWAQGVIDAHADLPVILSTHAYLLDSATLIPNRRTADGRSGQQIFEDLVAPNPQVFMVLGGHVHGEAHRVSINDAGQQVFELLANYQAEPNGGDAFMQLFEFVPQENRIDVTTYSPLLDQYKTDEDSQFSLSIDFQHRFNFAAPQPAALSLGPIDFLQLSELDPSASELWYRGQTSRAGLLTLEAVAAAPAAEVVLTLYDGQLNELATAAAADGTARVDWQTDPDMAFYVQLWGTGEEVDLRMANLVEISPDGSQMTVHGTEDDDTFEATLGSRLVAVINGIQYESESAATLQFFGGAGSDDATLTGSGGDELATLGPGTASITGQGSEVELTGVETIALYGGGGSDEAIFRDSAADDLFVGSPGFGRMTGAGFSLTGYDFDIVRADASAGGTDVAKLFDSPGDDRFVASPVYARIRGNGFVVEAEYFGAVHAYATAGGSDVAKLYDSPEDDIFYGSPLEGVLYGSTFYNRAKHFEAVHAFATAGGHDSAGDDTFDANPLEAVLHGDGFWNRAEQFDAIHAYATAGGSDTANLYGSDGRDSFYGDSIEGALYGDGFYNRAKHFEQIHAYAGVGDNDEATLYDAVLERGSADPSDEGPDAEFARVAWLYDFGQLYTGSRSSDFDPLEQAVDEVLTAYWP